MHVRRPSVRGAVLLPLVLALGAAGSSIPAVAAAGHGAATTGSAVAKAPVTGRFVTATRKGIVLVDETGQRERTLIKAKHADIVEMHPESGVFLYSTRKVWHISNLYGADLGEFRTPRHTSIPAVDTGGYVVYWVKQKSETAPATLMSLEVNDPQAKPTKLRKLGVGKARGISVSPDYQYVAVTLAGATGTSVQLVSHDGKIQRAVPATSTGASVYSDRVAWSPDSGQVAFTSGVAPATVGSVYRAPAAGDYAPVALPAAVPSLFDWSPDGATLLGGDTTGDLLGIDTTTGAVKAIYPVQHSTDAGVFWSGLEAGAFPHDKRAPGLKVITPSSDTVGAWRNARGAIADKGGSQLRYVVIAAFQRRGASWWALVGNGKHPTWKKFETRNVARYAAKERRAKITGESWELGIPKLTAGRLVVVVKATDGAGNLAQKTVAATLS